MSEELLIYHIFADYGVESEALSAYGRVVRVGWDVQDTNDSEPIRADARQLPLQPGADLAMFHPPCQRWSSLTHIHGDPSDHPNLIPLARELGKELADDYIIENVERAPLNNPVKLRGDMFGLPITYTRAFETSFHVEQPVIQHTISESTDVKPGDWTGSVGEWKSIKGFHGNYPNEAIKRSGIPAPYTHYLMRHWLRERNSCVEVLG